jgi:hypothetical protein
LRLLPRGRGQWQDFQHWGVLLPWQGDAAVLDVLLNSKIELEMLFVAGKVMMGY